jgi:hypothetical protein
MSADLSLVVLAAPKDEDVVAGPIGFVIFIGLLIAVALLGWSLNKHLKKAHRAADAGVYGDPVESGSDNAGRADTESAGGEK